MARISTKVVKKDESRRFSWGGDTYTVEQFMHNIVAEDVRNEGFSDAICKMIDNKHGPINIAGSTFTAGAILKAMQPERFEEVVNDSRLLLNDTCADLFKSAKAGEDIELPLYGILKSATPVKKGGLHFDITKSEEVPAEQTEEVEECKKADEEEEEEVEECKKAELPTTEPYESEPASSEDTSVESVEVLTEPDVAPEDDTPAVADEVLTEPSSEGTNSSEGEGDIPDAVVITETSQPEVDSTVPEADPLEDDVEESSSDNSAPDTDDIMKMIEAKKAKLAKENESKLPGHLQPFANNYRTTTQGSGKIDAVSMIHGAVHGKQ